MRYNTLELHPSVLRACRNSINQHLGNLDDLPKELANTIANLYYRQACYLANIREDPNFHPQEVESEKDIFRGVNRFIDTKTFDNVWCSKMPELVQHIRDCKKELPSNAYKLLIDTTMFMLRYRNKKALDTPLILQKIKRIFLKPVGEIPNLINYII